MQKFIKFFKIFLISLLVFILFFGLYYYRKLSKKDNKLVIVDETKINQKTEEKLEGELVFAFFGIDGERGLDYIKKKLTALDGKTAEERYFTTGNPSDTIMLVKIDKKTGKVNVVSVPRDTKVKIAGHDGMRKINASFAKDGPYAALDTLREFSNVDVTNYIAVDYKGVKAIVDIIGGVEIDVPFDMDYDDPTDSPPLHIHLKKGKQKLDGKGAMEFLRFRKSNKGQGDKFLGDVGRVTHQQYFIQELMKQTLSANNVTKLPRMIQAGLEHILTNISIDEMLELAKVFTSYSQDKLTIETIPGTDKYEGGASYFIADEEETAKLFTKIFK
ncbi:MAG: LCP family protein [Eubacteriales bacterium]|uniref:LCP family protein n=1 Tax=Fenollaria sp. TaxID=1965292 RepID=UPI002A765DF9|nr:LCP family protein [Fenollaria sp.]MDD7339884.1 LCP family protein [Eubacteriales bacterium]MDY3106591.1 LCP family protein [Fenollaria sp.]